MQLRLLRRHLSSSTSKAKLSLGIRREEKNRWERRVPLTPHHVQLLVQQHGATVYVEPSTRRIFPDGQFEKAGAVVTSDLSGADIIVGVKEVPSKDILPNKQYLCFSHTHKAQPYNMPTLAAYLEKKCRLLDYELMTDEQGRRLIFFGRHAGYVGMLDCLHGLGQRMLGLGYHSPFMYMGMGHVYKSLAAAKGAVEFVGNSIIEEGIPKAFSPMIFSFTGAGNVSQGAQEIFQGLPHEYVEPSDLPSLYKSLHNKEVTNRLYACQVEEQHHLTRKDGGSFNKHEYRTKPELYDSEFANQIAAYSSVIVNGAFWDSKYPRLLTNAQLRNLQFASSPPDQRPLAIADISCDINGGIECLSHITQIEEPFFYYDALKGVEHKDAQGSGVQILGVENLPSEMPLEASQFFSDRLYPHLVDLLSGNSSLVLNNAEICADGKLNPKHQRLAEVVKSSILVNSREQKRVLLLGSGFVAAPLVDYLVQKGVHITIASASIEEAKKLVKSNEHTEAKQINLPNDKEMLQQLVKDHDVTVSFVPAPMHPEIAQVCIEHQKHLVTASYISEEMRSLDVFAKQQGVALVNEMGLDPGIDHMSAMKMIDHIHEQGGKVTSFISWCGGLPAPEHSDVPLGYKFSWSPRGVLTAATNDAKYKYNNETCTIAGKDLLRYPFQRLSLYPGFNLEGLANRDSLKYPSLYGLEASEMTTFFRGTLRYFGFSKQAQMLKELGFFDTAPFNSSENFSHWKGFVEKVMARLSKKKNYFMANEATCLINWLLEDDQQGQRVSGVESPLDGMAKLLEGRLAYQKGERDLVILHHSFGVKFPKKSEERVFTSSLVTFGTFGETTAMAKTVGLPAAMAVRLLLEGKVKSRGIVTPTQREVYQPLLEELSQYGVKIIEKEQPTHLKNLYLSI